MADSFRLFCVNKMASIQYSALVASMSGKHNGSVHSFNQYGAYVRIKTNPVQPNSPAQQAVKSSFGSIAAAWRALTQAQRDQWNYRTNDFPTSKHFGKVIILSGFNFFQKINRNRAIVGLGNLTLPPKPTQIFSFTELFINDTYPPDGMIISFAPAIPVGTSIILELPPGLSTGINFVNTEYNIVQILTSADPSGTDITTNYIAKYGAYPAVGLNQWLRATPIDNASGLRGQSIHTYNISS